MHGVSPIALSVAFIITSKVIHVTCFTYRPIVQPISNASVTLINFQTPTEFLVGEISVFFDTYRDRKFRCNLGYRRVSPGKNRATFGRGKNLVVRFPSLSCIGLYVVQIIPGSSYRDEYGRRQQPCYNNGNTFNSNLKCPEVFRKLKLNEKHQWNCSFEDWKTQCENFREADPMLKKRRYVKKTRIPTKPRSPTTKRQLIMSFPTPVSYAIATMKSPELYMPAPENSNHMSFNITVIIGIASVTALVIVVAILFVVYLKHSKQAQQFSSQNLLRDRRDFVTQNTRTFRASKESIDTDSVIV